MKEVREGVGREKERERERKRERDQKDSSKKVILYSTNKSII